MRRLYDWVIHWAETAYATPALLVISFAESSFFPVPPDALLIPLCLGKKEKALRFAFLCTLASVMGGFFGYLLGWSFFETIGAKIVDFYHAQELFASLTAKFKAYSFWAILAAALTPIPYKIFTISAGLAKVPLLSFFLASLIGRGARFYAVALLLRIFGQPIRSFIDSYFNLLATTFLVLLIAGFVTIKYLF